MAVRIFLTQKFINDIEASKPKQQEGKTVFKILVDHESKCNNWEKDEQK